MYLSAFPAMADELDATASAVQLTLTAFLIGLATGQLFLGQLSDRLGRRTPLLVGVVVCLIVSLLCALSPTIQILIGLRFVQGFAGAAGVVIARAIVADRAEGAQAARLFSVMMVMGVLAPVLAPMLGGQVVAAFGWRAVFVFIAALNLFMLIGTLVWVPESLPTANRRPSGLKAFAQSVRSGLGNRRFLGYTGTLACTAAAMFGYISASPFVLQNILGLSPRAYSLTFGSCALAVAVSGTVSARLARRIPTRRLLAGGISAMVLITALMLLNVTVLGVLPWLTITLMACFMATIGFIHRQRHHAGAGRGAARRGHRLGGAGLPAVRHGALGSPLVGWPASTPRSRWVR
jgi:DHA1 family bicyclomycin/chloramphenicol resistance-like MFS transporter